jgi:Rod binding domain-containing protein
MDLATNNLVMNAAMQSAGAARHAQLEKAASALVAQTFFGTLLKQMRESPFRDEMFSGGRGGQAFGAMYDQQLAERMTRGAGHTLVRAIVRRFEGKEAYAQHARSTRVPLPQTGDAATYRPG